MRPFFLLALACIVRSAVAEENFPVVLLDTKDAAGHRVKFQTDLKTLFSAPRWTFYADGSDPPLSIGAAAGAAQKAALLRAPKADGISLGSMRFLRRDVAYSGGGFPVWFYVFAFQPVFTTGPAGLKLGPVMEIVVLLDRTAIYPTRAK
jgi:hypothetical protein